MNHAVILANNVNCVSCHTDLIHGTGQVSRRDCQNCHDQEHFLRDFDHRTIQVVENYHRVHAAGQRARCNDCHQLIDHKLMPLAQIQDAVALLSPVRQDCQHCHPDHHREQVEMLLGKGGFLDGAAGIPNPMTGSRANCRACHTASGSDPKEEQVITGTLESCRGCHGQEYVKLFGQWEEALTARLKEAQDLLKTTEERLQAATKPGDLSPNLTEAARLVARARANIHLVATANGIHNKNYALALLDQALHDLEDAGQRIAR
jgi:ribulose bisphosphate carboxylase small subunit